MIGHRLIILHTTHPPIASESDEGAIDSIAWRRDKRDVLAPTKAGFAWLREKKGASAGGRVDRAGREGRPPERKKGPVSGRRASRSV